MDGHAQSALALRKSTPAQPVQRRFAALLSIAVGLLLTFCMQQQSWGQLRTGNSTRSLYQATDGVQASPHDAQHAVRTASYTAAPARPRAVARSTPDVVVSPSKQMRLAKRGQAVVQAACSDCAAGAVDSHSLRGGAYLTDAGGLHGAGCGCGNCDLGCDSIAPTCATACVPGRGPLMSLWCRTSVRAEVPLFWRRAANPPALVTTSPAGTPADVAGQLGQATTTTLLGDSKLNEDVAAGFRITLGTWLRADKCLGIVFRYWNAGDQDDTFRFSSTAHPILARPFLNTSVANAFEQDTQLIAFPGTSHGNISVTSNSSLEGLELSLRKLLYRDRFTRTDWLFGYQHIGINEGLIISSNTNVTGGGGGLQGASIDVRDSFQTENDFNGFAIGLTSTRSFACWKMETLIRLGMGNLRRKVNIGGTTTTTSGAGATNTEPQGLLARNTNDQAFVDDTFVTVPEVGINFAYLIRPGLDFNVGYNYMLVPNVAQASQQLDNELAVNLSDPLVGALDPSLDFVEQSYWIHSLGLGLQLRY